MKQTRFVRSLLPPVFVVPAVFFVAAEPVVLAGPIVQPAAVSSNFAIGYVSRLSKIIDQSGLSVGYTSGVTDFDAYTAVATHDQTTATFAVGFTNNIGLPQEFTFQLSTPLTIDGISFWGFDECGSVTAFDLFADRDGSFRNGAGALLGSFSPVIQPGASVFSFPATTTQFVHLVATDSYLLGVEAIPGIGEVAFRQVSEPSAFTIAFPLLGLFVAGRRRLGKCV